MITTTEQALPSSLTDYRELEMQAVSDLRRLREISQEVGLEAYVIKLIDDVLLRNKESKFTMAVVGEFKRGKSTFINALLGLEVLPSDVLPCTATLNRVTYGEKPLVKVVFEAKNGQPEREVEIGINQLTDYVTQLTEKSKNTAAQVKEAVVYYPAPYLQNNVEIIDTPGLNDDDTMTEVTLSVVPHVSAAIFVIMPESPFSGSEGDFLHNKLLLSEMGRVIFVVNAIDRIKDPADRERILKEIQHRIESSVEKRLRQQFGINTEKYKLYRKRIGDPKVFGLSSYDALEGKLTRDEVLLAESRFPEFETALERFLTQTRGAIELQGLANRTVASSDEILKKLKIEMGALQMAPAEFEESYQKASLQLQSLRQRRQQEWSKIAVASQNTKAKVRPMVTEVEQQLKLAASYAISQAPVQPDDLDDIESLQSRLAHHVSQAIHDAGKRVGERIQLQVERDLEAEAHRLYDFAATVSQTLHHIELQFSDVEADASAETSSAGEGAAGAISLYTGFGGIWSGYREAGIQGALTGGVASIGTLFAGGFLLGIVGLPITLPAVIALGIASVFTGQKFTRSIFGQRRVEQFKKNYEAEVLKRVQEQMSQNRIDIQVYDSIDNAYRLLKERIVGEVNALTEQAQKTLDDLRDKKARHETLSQQKRQQLQQTQTEVQTIRKKGFALSEQLVEVTSAI
ncbi:MAG: dynamin family protein [Ardenticatenaceae bacterium]